MKIKGEKELVHEIIEFVKKIWYAESSQEMTISLDDLDITIQQVFSKDKTFYKVKLKKHHTENFIVS